MSAREPGRGFSADWLRLREPFDEAARAAGWAAADLRHWLQARRGADGDVSVIDLACGSGANLRHLAPRLGGPQRWHLVDHDPALLEALVPALAEWAQSRGFAFERDGDTCRIAGGEEGRAFMTQVRSERLDLNTELGRLPFADAQLVTASALLDLVSADWLSALVGPLAAARCAVLFALNVDGRTLWDPADADDAAVHAAFAAHQRRDKGFGPALGPEAVPAAARLLAAAGYRVEQAASDWRVDASASGDARGAAGALQQAMVQGMAAAALEQLGHATEAVVATGTGPAPERANAAGPERGDAGLKRGPAALPPSNAVVHGWHDRRLALPPHSRLRVGHLDLRAMP